MLHALRTDPNQGEDAAEETMAERPKVCRHCETSSSVTLQCSHKHEAFTSARFAGSFNKPHLHAASIMCSAVVEIEPVADPV